jgi:hypothetical protein
MREKSMKKQDNDMLDEYDFSKGIRGKYEKKYAEGSNIIVIEPEVSKEFPDAESVNEALKHLMLIIKKHQKKVRN